MLKIGTDPEFFLYDTKNKEYVSAHGMIPGDKKKPHKVDAGAIQVDGTAIEFNIDPVESRKDFIKHVDEVLRQLREMIDKRYEFMFVPIIQYKAAVFNKIPKEALELGCDPDYSAILLQHNVVPKTIGRYRTGSGHIHLGWTEGASTEKDSDHFFDCVIMARQMERFFAPYESAYDTSNHFRKMYYGGNAAFRPKPYGCEYRGLSNTWLTNKKLWGFVYDASVRAFEMSVEGTLAPVHYPYDKRDCNKFYKYCGVNIDG